MLMYTRMRDWQAGDGKLSDAPHSLTERSFRPGDIPAVRQFARAFGGRTRMEPAKLADFVLAVSEATASAADRGPGTARVRLWATGQRAYCEVRTDGLLARRAKPGETGSPAAGSGEVEALRRHLLRRLADYVSVASGPGGAWVLFSMTAA